MRACYNRLMKKHKKNSVFKSWLKIWPLTILLVLLGLTIGEYLNYTFNVKYSVRQDLAIVDETDGSSASEYIGLVDSDLTSNQIFKAAIRNDRCTMSGSGEGNVITFVATCPQDKAEATRLSEAAATNFTEWAQDIYGEENFKVDLRSNTPEVIVSLDRVEITVLILLISTVLAILISIAIAFVGVN